MIAAPAPLLTAALIERLVLLINHVLAQEPAATERLRPHAGQRLSVRSAQQPWFLPALPELDLRVTAAGLFEWCPPPVPGAPDLILEPDMTRPFATLVGGLAGKPPNVALTGDEALARDVDWLIANVRWDVREDLARLVGTAPAQQIQSLAAGLAQGLREALRALSLGPGRARPPHGE